nr:reverse transcriptase domain-containing protein [Tanacetum cinerariifolium]
MDIRFRNQEPVEPNRTKNRKISNSRTGTETDDFGSGLVLIGSGSVLGSDPIMPLRMRTRSASRPAAESQGGGTSVWVVEMGKVEDLGKVGNQENVGNQNGNVVNENVQENVGNVLVNGNRAGCSYKVFLACNPKEYDGKGGVVVLTRWIERIENVQDMSGCGIDQKVKYTASLFVEFCPRHGMKKLEIELWNHAMVGASHAAYTDRFHELARLVPHLVTPESRKIKRYVYDRAQKRKTEARDSILFFKRMVF